MPWNWKGFWKGLLLVTLLGAVWGVMVGVFDLKERFGSSYNIVNTVVIVGLVFWFARICKMGGVSGDRDKLQNDGGKDGSEAGD